MNFLYFLFYSLIKINLIKFIQTYPTFTATLQFSTPNWRQLEKEDHIRYINERPQWNFRNYDSPCEIHAGRPGVCTILQKCPQLSNLLENPMKISPGDVEILRGHHCGWENSTPKLCCVPEETIADVRNLISTTVPPPPEFSIHRNFKNLNHEICGTRKEQKAKEIPNIDSRIFGGERAGILEFPWMAMLFYRTLNTGQLVFRCGGSVISQKFVLTAAHCVSHLSSRFTLSRVRLGEYDTRTNPDCEPDSGTCARPHQEFQIDGIYPHNGYSPETRSDDIALIRVDGIIQFHPMGVRPICLPVQEQQEPPEVIVTGWGATERLPQSPELLKVALPLITTEQCQKLFNITYTQICAGSAAGRDSCKGDSGGPLQGDVTYFEHGPRVIQFGVVSYGRTDCGAEGVPGVYTRVDYYIDWILDHLKN